MKFILNEGAKFILEERFILTEANILTEASADTVAQSWTQKFKATFENTEAVLKKYIELAGLSSASSAQQTQFKDLNTALKTTAQELENTMELPVDDLIADKFTTAKAELKSYIDVLSQLQKAVKPTTDTKDTFTLLAAKIKELNVLRTRFGQWKSQDSEAVRQTLSWVTEKILPIIDTAAIDADASNIDAFKKTCGECLERLEELKKLLPETTEGFGGKSTEDIKAYCTIIKQVVENIKLPEAKKLNKGLVIANIKKYQTQVEALKDSYTKLIASAILTQRATEAELAALKNQTDSDDWKTKLASAINKETVIEEFIYTTWQEQAEKVIKIKKAFLHECEQYGFLNSGEHQNPFITFISEVYLNPSYNVQPQTYNAIHNLVANKVLNSKDITGTGVMTKGNLVFCKALYRLEPDKIRMYIKKQHNILQAATKPDMFASTTELAFNILYAVPSIQSGKATKDSTDMQLRSIAQIEQLEEKWIGTVSSTAEDSTAKTKIAANEELLKQIKDTTAATKLLVTLAIKFSSNEKLTALVQAYAETRQLMTKSTTPIELQKLVASVENLYKITNINAAQALSLSKSVVESDQFEFTKE